MRKVKIYGAGSIGNHLAHASRSLGWEVHLCDVDDNALERTKKIIYPTRYGKWDEAINLYNVKDAPVSIYDLIIIGTPPDYHLDLAIKSLAEQPKAILIEKPLCTPDLHKANELFTLSQNSNTIICVGYDHVLGMASRKIEEIIEKQELTQITTIDVEFREHWRGIFNAHPWLSGPQDTYLGYWKKGGGACGEHSHAINLWQHISHKVGAGRVVEVSAMIAYASEGRAEYDKLCAINLKTETGLIGRVIQDVITLPPKKWGRIQGLNRSVEWQFGYKPGVDTVFYINETGEKTEYNFEKTRPDDFIIELNHINDLMDGRATSSGISLNKGLDSMLVIAASHLSAHEKRNVAIDYAKGYLPDALHIV